jgi:hypothetical protein
VKQNQFFQAARLFLQEQYLYKRITVTLMKNLTQHFFFLLLTLFLTAESFAQFSYTSSLTKANGVSVYKWKEGRKWFEVEHKGDIDVNANATDITAIAPKGFISISSNAYGKTKKIELRSTAAGEIKRSYYVGNTEVPYDYEAEKWLADVLPEVVKSTGFGAESRVDKFYLEGGTKAVVEEIETLTSNSVKQMYFEYLLKKEGVENLAYIAESISRTISSNSTRAELYEDYQQLFLADEGANKAYFKGIDRISSNSEKGDLLEEIIDDNNLTVAQYQQVLAVVEGLSSNTEKGEVLMTINGRFPNHPAIVSAYFDAIQSMSSNTEAGRVLRDLMDEVDSEQILEMTLKSLQGLSSNTEVGEVLRELTDKLTTDKLVPAYLEAVQSMSSNSEMSRSLIALLDSDVQMSSQTRVLFLNTSHSLSSNSELGRVLREAIILLENDDEAVTAAYLRAFSYLTSNTEKEDVLEEVIDDVELTPSLVQSIIRATKSMSSDTSKADVLVELAEEYSGRDAAFVEAYKSAAAELTSDYQFRKVMDALD